MDAEGQVTTLLRQMRGGDQGALDRLLPLVYDELRQVAHRQLRHLRQGHTLDTTALVHEAYLKLAGQSGLAAADRAHFFGIAGRAMRQILVDRARRHGTQKRGGAWRRVGLGEPVVAMDDQADMLLALDGALTRLAALDERLSRIVECRFFAGMTEPETAAALGLSERTVRRGWLKARLWLYRQLVDATAG